MAAQTTNMAAGLFQKMGKRVAAAHQEYAGTEVKYGNMGDLPAGIQNGIAKLVDAKIDKVAAGKENAGEYYFYAAGVVVEPTEFTDKVGNVHKPAGMRTSIIEMLCDTPNKAGEKSRKTFEEHWGWMYNELKKLGVDTSKLDPSNLEVTLKAMVEAGIYFKFRTFSFPKRQPGEPGYDQKYADRDPMVFHDWQGAVEYQEADAGSGVEDSTPKVNEAPPANKPPVKITTAANPAPGPKPQPTKAPDTSADMGDDLSELAKLADNGDESAGAKLTAECEKNGVDPSAYDNWEAVAKVLTGDKDVKAQATEAAADDTPEVGQVYDYRVPKKGPGGKVMGRADKPIDVKITAVDRAAQTVDLLSLTDGKTTYKNVPWGTLGAE